MTDPVTDPVAWLSDGPARAGLLLLALALDAVIGDPAWLYRRVPHPVVVMGHAIAWLDRCLNREHHTFVLRRAAGVLALALMLLGAAGLGIALQRATLAVPGGWLLEALLASTLLAQRSLYEHVAAVRKALAAGSLAKARRAVSLIVGRDPDSLDESGVARAAIESAAENFADGVVAPALWYLLLGLPGLVAYKAINTADSMIGHRTPRHRAFGWAAARLDDLVNLPAARLSAVLLGLAGGTWRQGRQAWRCVWADAPRHRSPNAGWPEAALAGALGLALAGPRRYGAVLVEDVWINPQGRREAGPADIASALRLLGVACGIGWSLVVLVWTIPEFVYSA